MAVLMTGLMSCEKEGEDGDEDKNGDFYLTAKLGEASFTADLSDTETWGAFKYHEGSLTISVADNIANVGEGTLMLNILDGYKGAGTYKVGVGGNVKNYARYTTGSMGTGNLNFWAAETGSASSANDIGTGSIVVTSEKGGVVEGTFQFDGYNNNNQTTKNITEGKFRLKVN